MQINRRVHCEVVDLIIPIAGEMEEKEKLKNLLKRSKWYIAKFLDIQKN